MRLWESVRARLSGANPAQMYFLGHLLKLLLLISGRATFRNLSRYSPYHEKTFSRWFRRQFDWVTVNYTAIKQRMPPEHKQVLAFNPSFVPKSGKRTTVWTGSGTASIAAWRKGWKSTPWHGLM